MLAPLDAQAASSEALIDFLKSKNDNVTAKKVLKMVNMNRTSKTPLGTIFIHIENNKPTRSSNKLPQISTKKKLVKVVRSSQRDDKKPIP